MKSEFVTVSGGRRWEVFIGGEGAPLLWLHGLRGVDLDDPVLAALQKNHRVIAPVAPGFNDLDELASIDNIHELVLDYDTLVMSQGLEQCVLVGHSFGAMIAADLAAHFPARVTQLALLSPFGLWSDEYPVADIFAIPYMQMDDILWHDQTARERFARPAIDSNDPKAAAAQTVRLARSLTAITKFVWPIPDRGLRRRLARISSRALALFGAEDRVVSPRYAADFESGIARCSTEVIAEAGHMLPYEKSTQVLDKLQAFLAAPRSN
jgi:pimeloyl-ACP methyl ester carboxylesterase